MLVWGEGEEGEEGFKYRAIGSHDAVVLGAEEEAEAVVEPRHRRQRVSQSAVQLPETARASSFTGVAGEALVRAPEAAEPVAALREHDQVVGRERPAVARPSHPGDQLHSLDPRREVEPLRSAATVQQRAIGVEEEEALVLHEAEARVRREGRVQVSGQPRPVAADATCRPVDLSVAEPPVEEHVLVAPEEVGPGLAGRGYRGVGRTAAAHLRAFAEMEDAAIH